MYNKYQHKTMLRILLVFSLSLLATGGAAPASADGPMAANTLSKEINPASALLAPPTAIEALNFTAIDAGMYHTCALVAGGGVKCWGYNAHGELGNDDTSNTNMPVDVVGLASGATVITAGHSHTCAVLSSGGVSGWNFPPNVQGTLSINNYALTTSLTVSLSGNFIVFLNSSGAGPGSYIATFSTNPSAAIGFALANGEPLRPKEGGGQTFLIPPGIAYHFLYLPIVTR